MHAFQVFSKIVYAFRLTYQANQLLGGKLGSMPSDEQEPQPEAEEQSSSSSEEEEGQDLLLSILLSKILVKYKNLKIELSHFQHQSETDPQKLENDHPDNISLKSKIYEIIDIDTVLEEVTSISKGHILLSIPPDDFYELATLVDSSGSSESEVSENQHPMFDLLKRLFPLMTSKSQIELVEADLPSHLTTVTFEQYRYVLNLISSPMFKMRFLKHEIKKNIN